MYSRFTKTSIAVILAITLLPLQTFALSLNDVRADVAAKKEVAELRVQEVQQEAISQRTLHYKEGEIVVKYKNDSERFRTISLPAGASVEAALATYNNNPSVEYAEPNYMAYADTVPNDPLYSPYQWNLDNATGSGINAEQAWDITTGSHDVIVAVIDTGVAYENSGRSLDQGWSFSLQRTMMRIWLR